MRAANYARVSTLDQEPENQPMELRHYAETRGWTLTEYVDRGVSGAKDRRPALDRLVADARRRRVTWSSVGDSTASDGTCAT
jgi:DNA invertase Pin-like site-specific DNA recombinase